MPSIDAILTQLETPANAENAAGMRRYAIKKAVNWALRQVGKRSHALNAQALAAVETIAQLDTPTARWIANDARRELTDPKTLARIKR